MKRRGKHHGYATTNAVFNSVAGIGEAVAQHERINVPRATATLQHRPLPALSDDITRATMNRGTGTLRRDGTLTSAPPPLPARQNTIRRDPKASTPPAFNHGVSDDQYETPVPIRVNTTTDDDEYEMPVPIQRPRQSEPSPPRVPARSRHQEDEDEEDEYDVPEAVYEVPKEPSAGTGRQQKGGAVVRLDKDLYAESEDISF